MHSEITHLLDALQQVEKGPPKDLNEWMMESPKPEFLPSPWDTWTLIGLVRHRTRQYWVADIMRTRLGGNPEDLATRGSFGHPTAVARSGIVPGMPEWEYYFHGRGLCLSHKVDGTDIDVDFFDDSADYFDAYFYRRFLDSLKKPNSVEQRIRELFPTTEPVHLSIQDLLKRGALLTKPGGGSNAFRVASELLERQDDFEDFCNRWDVPGNRLWLAALIGDWVAVRELTSPGTSLDEFVNDYAAKAIDLRVLTLKQFSSDNPSEVLYGLAHLNVADDALLATLRGPISGAMSAALSILEQQDDPQWCEAVHSLFLRMPPDGEIPAPHIWITALKFLLRHHYHTKELLPLLPKADKTSCGEGVILALEYAPEHVISMVRKGLSHTIPIARTEVSAILAVIAKPWCIHELALAISQSDDHELTADARAALLEIGSPEAEKAVLVWEERNPRERETGSFVEIGGRTHGPFHTSREHNLAQCNAYLRFEMASICDRVMPWREVVPTSP